MFINFFLGFISLKNSWWSLGPPSVLPFFYLTTAGTEADTCWRGQVVFQFFLLKNAHTKGARSFCILFMGGGYTVHTPHPWLTAAPSRITIADTPSGTKALTDGEYTCQLCVVIHCPPTCPLYCCQWLIAASVEWTPSQLPYGVHCLIPPHPPPPCIAATPPTHWQWPPAGTHRCGT